MEINAVETEVVKAIESTLVKQRACLDKALKDAEAYLK